MAFTIPNNADTDAAFHVSGVSPQAAPDKVDVDILVAGYAGTGVVTGCAVTAQGSPDMTLAVAVGTVAVAGVQVAVSAGNVTITTAHATNPRFDLVVVNSSGTKSVTAGTAAASPAFPSIPGSSLVLAAVYVPANDTAIGSTQIVDKRVVLDPRFTAITTNTQTASYVLVLTDAGVMVEMNVASGNTLTVPPNSSVPFPVGTVIGWRQYGAGQITLTPGSGVTIRASGSKLKSAAQYSEGAFTKRATDEWVAAGDLTT